MANAYQPGDLESRHYRRWEDAGYFAPSGQGQPYCIVIPPPNVTGTLHMGHAFQDTIMDALIRYHRMRGCNTLWHPGPDHAGIATQMVVERLLAAEGTSKRDLGSEAFLERVWEWKAHSGGRITVLSGADGSVLRTYTGQVAGETLGFDADGMGDVDGDGHADYLVTSAWSLIEGARSGRTLVIAGGGTF